MRVQIAIPEIIDGASSSTHHQRSYRKDAYLAEHSSEWRNRRCEGSSKKRAEEAGEEEVICSCRFVQPDELCVRNP
jgi:hypothetical protein